MTEQEAKNRARQHAESLMTHPCKEECWLCWKYRNGDFCAQFEIERAWFLGWKESIKDKPI